MALHLVELYLNVDSADKAKQIVKGIDGLLSGGFPPGVTKVAGPWVSNEETKLIMILDIQDHVKTVGPFWRGITNGHILKRRFTPIVEWEAVKATINELS